MPRNATPSRSFGVGKSRVDSFEIISAPPRNPAIRVLALLLRLRAELLVLALLLTAWVALGPDHAPGPDGVVVGVPGTGLDATTRPVLFAAVGLLLAGLPWTRRFLFHRAQAVLTRHRVRQALLECRVLNSRSRACPLTVWARPTRVGEVVWLFLRAGIGPHAVEEQAEELAATCFAREARVTAWPSSINVVRVEIIRRDPLAPNLIRSDLFRYAAGDVHEEWPTNDRGTETPAPRPKPSRPVLPALPRPALDSPQPGGRGGDWSDYV
ncbi:MULTISPECIES: hypothetical protein [unclassified Pseudonocardia]|uniref:hypothetical protein n=1 Tax=unclassified Pseudonocardia TaxID=2619320 RepID=UPI0001FFE6BD|nr:hypothetical protein [Pseudonocardia sp. Ae707_Ps1]OLM18210.1 hypothetical protein Ae707Ps1_2469c [Pseudonocardia sp. Ae707_Ps1]